MSEFNRFEEYKLFVEDTARLSDRRQTISNIYVTVNSILLAAIGLIIKDLGANGCWLLILPFPLVIAGIAVCIWWHQLILKYKRLIGLRMDTLRIAEDDPEMKSAIKMCHKEDKIYERDSKGKVLEEKILAFADLESRLPSLFIILYGLFGLGLIIALIYKSTT